MTQPTQQKTRVAIYLRVSTDRQAREDRFGLSVQEDSLRSFCKHNNYELTEEHVYRDAGFSGSLESSRRPAMTAMYEAAERQEFNIILVYRVDRFFRDTLMALGDVKKLDSLNVTFQSVTEPFDTRTAIGRFMLTIYVAQAEAEREAIRQRTMAGKLRAAKEGRWATGIPPYGFCVDQKTKKLVIVESEAKVVRTMYKWLVDEKLPLREIERRMNQKKIPPPFSTKIKVRTTNNYWYRRTIGRILTNEVYTGTFYYRKYKRPFKNLTSVIDQDLHRPEDEWVKMDIPPVISKAMFDMATTQLTKNRELAKRNQKRDYMFSKLIYCGKCDHKLFSGFQPPRKHWKEAGGRYYHGVYRKPDAVGTTQRCTWCTQYAESRLSPVWDCLKDILNNPENIHSPLERYIFKEEDPSKIRSRLKEIDAELETIRDKQRRVTELYINDQIDSKQHSSYSSEHKREEQKLLDETTRLRQTLLSKKEQNERELAIKKAHAQIREKLDTVSYAEKTQILRFFVERISLFAQDNYAEVVFRFPNNTEKKTVDLVSRNDDDFFPLVLRVKTISENERRAQILRANPAMYIPKTLV